jgi:hypothetical protein
LKTKKAVTPQSVYGDELINEKGEFNIEPFTFIACVCPSCNQEVPYRHYCCECGQKFIVPNEKE